MSESRDELRSSKLRVDSVDSVKQSTSIWQEQANSSNAYQAVDAWCHGFNLFEVAQKRSFEDMFFLLFTGELPSADKARLLRHALIVFINPGPRHEATRVGVTAAASMTYEEHLLPLVVSAFGGKRGGAGNIRACMQLLEQCLALAPQQAAAQILAEGKSEGVGEEYGEPCAWTNRCLEHFMEAFPETLSLRWMHDLDCELKAQSGHRAGVKIDLLLALIFHELGFAQHAAVGLYQLMAAPGMFAHAAEYIRKPSTSLPFVQDENYVLED